MNDRSKSFRMHDASVCFEAVDNRAVFECVLRMLRVRGFEVMPHPRIVRDYPALAKEESYWYARKGALEVNLECHTRLAKVEFYQNVVRENPHGGEYDFNKVNKMPYLVRLRFLLERWHVVDILKAVGLRDESKPERFDSPEAEVLFRIQDCCHSKDKGLLDWAPRDSYNRTDADGVVLVPGERRYFYHWRSKRLCVGTIYYHLNNMWYVVAGSEVHNIANFELFAFKPGLSRRKRLEGVKRKERLTSELARMIKGNDFTRAKGLCEALATCVAANGGKETR